MGSGCYSPSPSVAEAGADRHAPCAVGAPESGAAGVTTKAAPLTFTPTVLTHTADQAQRPLRQLRKFWHDDAHKPRFGLALHPNHVKILLLRGSRAVSRASRGHKPLFTRNQCTTLQGPGAGVIDLVSRVRPLEVQLWRMLPAQR